MVQTVNPTLMQSLKQATRKQHDQIEENPLTKAIVDNTINRHQYETLLERFYGFHKAVESSLTNVNHDWQTYGIDIQERLKAPKLHQDLVDLGFSDEAVAQLPLCQDLPQLDSFAQCLGLLYVLEGSTLGGQVLLRHLRKTLPFAEKNKAVSYFNAYGVEGLKEKWLNLQQALNQYAEQNPKLQEQILNAAQDTFTKLDKWLLHGNQPN